MEDVEHCARRRPFSRSPWLRNGRFLRRLMKEVVHFAIQGEGKRGSLKSDLFSADSFVIGKFSMAVGGLVIVLAEKICHYVSWGDNRLLIEQN